MRQTMTVQDWLHNLNHNIIDGLFQHATDPVASCCALYNEIKLGTIEVPHPELTLTILKQRIQEAAE